MQHVVSPSIETSTEAQKALQTLRAFSRNKVRQQTLTISGDEAVTVQLPPETFELLMDILAQLAGGNGVTVVPINAELTTQQVADMLNVSRPYVVKILDEGAMPFRKVGTHRRVKVADLLAYKAQDTQKRQEAMEALAAQAQDLDMGY